jgi:hypothetical protein
LWEWDVTALLHFGFGFGFDFGFCGLLGSGSHDQQSRVVGFTVFAFAGTWRPQFGFLSQ